MLKMFDVKTTQKTKCVAENKGGRTETPFTIYVAGIFLCYCFIKKNFN